MLNEEETRGSSRGIKTCNLAQIFFFFFDEEETCIARHPPGIYKYRRNELYPIRDLLIVGVFHINFVKFNLSLSKLELGLIVRSTRYNPRSRCLASFFIPLSLLSRGNSDYLTALLVRNLILSLFPSQLQIV